MKTNFNVESKKKEKLRIAQITKFILDFMFYGGILVIVTLPVSIKIYGEYNVYFREKYFELNILFFLSGILAVLIILELRRIFKSVLNDDCFIKENVKSLNRMGIYSFGIAIVTVGRMILYLTPAVMIVIIVFLIAGLFSKVLSQVFDTAITYKEENDLTI